MASKRKLSDDFEQPITIAPATRARASSVSSTTSFTLPRILSDIDSDLVSPRRASFDNSTPILDFSYVNTHALAPNPSLTLDRSYPHPLLKVDFRDGTDPFHIHQNILAHYSPFFAELLDNAKNSHDAVSLNMETLEGGFHRCFERHIFGYFVNWLYTQKVQDQHGYALKLVDLAKLYKLFNQFRVPGVTETMLQDIEDSPFGDEGSGHCVKDFQHYAYTKGDEELQDIAVDRAVTEMPEYATYSELDKFLADIPSAMKDDFTKALIFRCGSLKKRVKNLKAAMKDIKAIVNPEKQVPRPGRVQGRVSYVDLTAAVEVAAGDENASAATPFKDKASVGGRVSGRVSFRDIDAVAEASMVEGNEGLVSRYSNNLPSSGRASGRVTYPNVTVGPTVRLSSEIVDRDEDSDTELTEVVLSCRY